MPVLSVIRKARLEQESVTLVFPGCERFQLDLTALAVDSPLALPLEMLEQGWGSGDITTNRHC